MLDIGQHNLVICFIGEIVPPLLFHRTADSNQININVLSNDPSFGSDDIVGVTHTPA